MYERLMDVPPEAGRRVGLTARLFVSGSAPLPAPTLERFRRLYGHTILERYGMSEALGAISNPYVGERRPGTVGKPLPGVSVQLSDGDSGEVLLKSPTVFAGYWHNEVATKAAFTADGYFRTGDLATRSPDGYYRLQGRRTELIISGGFNIYPQEIEELLREQPGVSEAVVVGEPDLIRGQYPVAYVVADPARDASGPYPKRADLFLDQRNALDHIAADERHKVAAATQAIAIPSEFVLAWIESAGG